MECLIHRYELEISLFRVSTAIQQAVQVYSPEVEFTLGINHYDS